MFWPITRFAIAVPALVMIALQQSNTWSSPSTLWQATPFLIIALVGAVEPFVAGIRERITTLRIDREVTFREILGELLARVEYLTTIPCAELGTSVYKMGRWRPGQRRLQRVARLRLAPRPASNVAWFMGKGVVGLCAELQTDVVCDVFRLQPAITTPDEWEQLPGDITLGLGWDEYELVRGKHGHILGTPINHPRSGRIIGVVTLDGLPEQSAVLDTETVRQSLREAATACARQF